LTEDFYRHGLHELLAFKWVLGILQRLFEVRDHTLGGCNLYLLNIFLIWSQTPLAVFSKPPLAPLMDDQIAQVGLGEPGFCTEIPTLSFYYALARQLGQIGATLRRFGARSPGLLLGHDDFDPHLFYRLRLGPDDFDPHLFYRPRLGPDDFDLYGSWFINLLRLRHGDLLLALCGNVKKVEARLVAGAWTLARWALVAFGSGRGAGSRLARPTVHISGRCCRVKLRPVSAANLAAPYQDWTLRSMTRRRS
jgi:hypothetical protein